MEIIPVINCSDIHCVEERMNMIRSLGASWAQIDVADGIFAPIESWNEKSQISNPPDGRASLKSIFSSFPEINLEVHLMVRHPLEVVDDWISLGAKRIIFHAETISLDEVEKMKGKVEIGIALLPETPVEDFDKFSSVSNFVQILAVPQGFSGGKFKETMIGKIERLREKYKNIDIEIDGGITPLIAEKIKHAGANIATSGSFIFNSENPIESYRELCKV